MKIEATRIVRRIYCVAVRNNHTEERLVHKFEHVHTEEAVHDDLDQVDKNQLAEKDEFEAEQEAVARQPHSRSSTQEQRCKADGARERERGREEGRKKG